MSDINGDGRMDVYGQAGSTSESGNPDDRVYVNTGGMTFATYAAAPSAGLTTSWRYVLRHPDGLRRPQRQLETPVPGPVQFITWRPA